MSMHQPGPQRKNKYANWHACKRCGLRLSYTAKSGYTGESRAIGADPPHVAAAQEEPKMIYSIDNMNEKIFNGKLMEVRGRGLVQSGGAGRTTVEIKANEKLGKWLMGAQASTAETPPGAMTSGSMAPTTPVQPLETPRQRSTTPTRSPTPQRSSTAAPKMAPGFKMKKELEHQHVEEAQSSPASWEAVGPHATVPETVEIQDSSEEETRG